MGEAATQIFEDLNPKKKDSNGNGNGNHNDETCESVSSLGHNSSQNSDPAISSSDLVEDDATSSNGPLHDLSDLMAQLPIRRGLSKYYEGKSQSLYNIGSVRSVEELAKKVVNPKMKSSSKTYTRGFHAHNKLGPKPTISKKG
ncbi:hypothetical protein V6N13_037514 [Hibiscus sabdariffa]|uniref:Oxidative stress 3 n=1 Tax=Hibiscus sabdariffa TaxID=183260 RepID=A0ABR2S4Z7_9ROSI